MVCPSCGAQIEGQGKFCAVCGAHLPEAVPPPPLAAGEAPVDQSPAAPAGDQVPPPPPPAAAPAWNQTPPPPPAPPYQPAPAPVAQPSWGQTPPPPPSAPAWGQPPAQAQVPLQQYGGQPYAPAYGSQAPYAAPAATPAAGGSPIGGLLALAGGAVAIGSAFLPWLASSYKNALPIEQTDPNDLANGYYLIAAGAVAAVAGLALLLKMMPGLRPILALAAIVAGAAVLGIEYRAYVHATDTVNYLGSGSGVTVGMGLYVGAGGGIGAILGGLLGLVGKR